MSFILESGLKKVLELILLSTMVHSIQVLGDIEIFIFAVIYHKQAHVCDKFEQIGCSIKI